MARKRRNNQDSILLEEISTASLTAWNRLADLLDEYHVQLFYYLEGLRTIKHEQFCKALNASESVQIHETDWWRIVDHKYSNAPLSPQGSINSGGRFNIGHDLNASGFQSFPALYIADSEEGAYIEKFGERKAANSLSPHELNLRIPSSYSAVRVQVSLENIFDMTKLGNLKKFTDLIASFKLPQELKELAIGLKMKKPYLISKPSELKLALLSGGWNYYPLIHDIPANSQLFGRMLKDAGFEGVLYPSAKKSKHKNLALFVQNFETSSAHVELQDKSPRSVKIKKLDSTNWDKSFSLK